MNALAPEVATARSQDPGPFNLLGQAWVRIRAVSGRLLLLIVIAQLVITVVASPLVAWIFREALRANGMYALDTNTFSVGWGFGLTVILLMLILLVVMWLLVAEFSAIVILLHRPSYSAGELFSALGQVMKKALRPKSWFMILYLLVLLPLSGFGFVSGMLHGVQVPNFITGELEKEPLYATLLTVAYILLAYVNLRLSLTMPIFALTDRTGNAALKESWAKTRGVKPWTILVAVFLLVAAAGLFFAALFYICLAPTAIADTIAPGASWIMAALGLGVAHVASMLAIGLTVAFLAGLLVYYAEVNRLVPSAGKADTGDLRGRKPRIIAVSSLVIACVVSGVLSLPSLQNVADHPETLVLAHRGWTAGGVENSIEALEAAAELDVDFVEFDTMRTADGKYVVIHDPALGRLAGINKSVKDMTLEELTSTQIHDEAGHTSTIPELVEYVSRAKELDQPLLIEVKLSGAEPEASENIADIVALLDENDLLEGNMFHSLDHASAEAIKTQLPDVSVGYIMPFAGVDVPDTLADFLVLEESSATDAMHSKTDRAGLGMFVWTVEDQDAMRLRFRQSADGIITDHPDLALKIREDMDNQTGLAGRLHDVMLAFMKPF
ncbi:glycerophosphoryl diester phosphodiesterase membrane domain-containing protein [Actinomycetaceae bacterium MB13-C1-2]|nr:glycerophosphoryl diester phosphodiesterase membrane domain-containing protein [Actinomycetaceae bacterium MB13-C1-2]